MHCSCWIDGLLQWDMVGKRMVHGQILHKMSLSGLRHMKLTRTAQEKFGETTKISTRDAGGEFGWTPTSGLTQVAEEEFLWNSTVRFYLRLHKKSLDGDRHKALTQFPMG